jgi:adenylate cyclase class IV
MKFLEIEFKYNADDVKLDDFVKFCLTHNPGEHKKITASGFDHFYDNTEDPDAFGRLRVGPDVNQLTFKRKTQDANNFIRTEHNIDLAGHTARDQIDAFLGEFGYKYNMSLFKNCFVYIYDTYTFVYYICYDVAMKELGRFIEIEMSEEHSWVNETEAYNHLLVLEKLMKSLGISPQNRIKRSLYELYRKEAK